MQLALKKFNNIPKKTHTTRVNAFYYQQAAPMQQAPMQQAPMQQEKVSTTYQNFQSRMSQYKMMDSPPIEFLKENAISIFFIGAIIFSSLIQAKQTRFMTRTIEKINPETITIKFNDVAGLEEAKMELQEVVEFLKSPEKFTVVGAKIPKGCLLTGGPGLGKTLLAKAVAGEAHVPFFASSASEYVEMFAGVGAMRIRELFKKAKENKPCIIFIDEIDAIGRKRSSASSIIPNDERDQTINQLLTEMDGFNDNTGIIIIAATNRADVLDPALIRPGRFDRQVVLEPPTYNDRTEILKIHTKDKPLEDNVFLEDVAKLTSGLSGAELANVANEAAIMAARRNSKTISATDFNNAIDRIILGTLNNSLISKEKKMLIAYHEAGHALVALKVKGYDQLTKVSIIPRGKARGVTMFAQDIDNGNIYSREYIEKKLFVALGGRAAEEIQFGKEFVTTGSIGDLEVVANLSRAMIQNYGYSDELGPVSWTNETMSDEFAKKIDETISSMVKGAYIHTKQILTTHKRELDLLAKELYEKEELTIEDVKCLLMKMPMQTNLHS
jgi:cell division protease FtsH